jgi:hypothetical protein
MTRLRRAMGDARCGTRGAPSPPQAAPPPPRRTRTSAKISKCDGGNKVQVRMKMGVPTLFRKAQLDRTAGVLKIWQILSYFCVSDSRGRHHRNVTTGQLDYKYLLPTRLLMPRHPTPHRMTKLRILKPSSSMFCRTVPQRKFQTGPSGKSFKQCLSLTAPLASPLPQSLSPGTREAAGFPKPSRRPAAAGCRL